MKMYKKCKLNKSQKHCQQLNSKDTTK